MTPTLIAALLATLVVGLSLGTVIGVLWARARETTSLPEVVNAAAEQAVLREGLDRLHDELRDLAHHRATWQGQLAQQVEDMRHSTDLLRRETSALSGALRKPQVRGQWGELQLRRAVELAGLVAHCDFVEQERFDDGAQRPDLVVHLAGGRRVVVDAKVPLEAFLDAGEAADDAQREAALRRHVGHVRSHVDQLSSKAYWRALGAAPEFVVMYLPAEAFLSAALDSQRDLLDHAASRKVILATPTTLIALLRTVAHGWSHEALTDQAQEILALGRELHDRLSVVAGHVDKLGQSLNGAVTAYNRTVGSLESRVLVTARRFEDAHLGDTPVPTPRQVESRARSLQAVPSPHEHRRAVDDQPPASRTLSS